jgi:ferredoxin--NADP+ reductase
MSDRIKPIVENISIDREDTIERALDQTDQLKELTDEEKIQLAAAFSTLFYHDYAGLSGMIKLASRAEKQIAKFGAAVMDFLISELVSAPPESAAHLGRPVARNGKAAVKPLMEAWEKNRSEDYALINLLYTLANVKDPEVLKAMPEIVVAAKSKNPQLRSTAIYSVGRLVNGLSADGFDDNLRLKMFDCAFEALSDAKPIVRKHGARTLGKMLKKGLLNNELKGKVLKAYNAILGNDEDHEWDNAFIVRHEAEHFLPLCKTDGTLADRYRQSFRIASKRELCPDTYHFEIEAPFIARKIKAGQFIIIRPHAHSERIPLSICGWDREKGLIKIIIMAAGRTTGEMNRLNVGDRLQDIVGPLGQRSHVKKHNGTCVVIGGGYGTGAIIPTAVDLRELGNKVIGIVGARMESLLIMIDELKEACDEVMLTTNDGSVGIKGFVTHALEEILKRGEKVSHVLAVGPVPMMIAVSNMTKPLGIETYVSLNAIMVDGTGMCGSCRVSVGGETKFACFHGPDFDGHKVDFDQLMMRQKMFIGKEKEALAAMEG